MKLYNIFKRLACKHDWKCKEETLYNITLKCNKCGKIKTYWN